MSVLTEASEVVDGPRAQDYGHPADNHSTTAKMVSAWLQRRYGVQLELDAIDVCAFNDLQKTSRLANTPDHHDSLVDKCGYTRNWEMILERESVNQSD